MAIDKVTEDLLKRARAGEARAVFEVVQRIEPGCRVRIARVLLGVQYSFRADVDDILQDTLIAFLRREGGPADRWEPTKGSFENFAAGKAELLALDLRRKRRKEGWVEDEAHESTEPKVDSSREPERQYARRQLAQKSMDACQDEQSELGREMFRLLVREGRDAREVAALMNMSLATVHTWHSRLLRRLKEIAEELGSKP